MGQLLLNRCDTTGVFAADDAGYLSRRLNLFTLAVFGVGNEVNRNTGVDIADYVEVKVDNLVYLDDVLFAHFNTICVCDEGNHTGKLIEL